MKVCCTLWEKDQNLHHIMAWLIKLIKIKIKQCYIVSLIMSLKRITRKPLGLLMFSVNCWWVLRKEIELIARLILNTCEAMPAETFKSFTFCTSFVGCIKVKATTPLVVLIATVPTATFINVNLTVFACSPLITDTVVWPRKINACSTVARLTWQNMSHSDIMSLNWP